MALWAAGSSSNISFAEVADVSWMPRVLGEEEKDTTWFVSTK
jgi:hypothetical protein